MFIIYRRIPFLILTKNEKYFYSNLPNYLGLNTVNNSITICVGIANEQTCSFTMILRCGEEPLITPLSTLPCLEQLFEERVPTFSTCQGSRSQEIQPGIINIGEDA